MDESDECTYFPAARQLEPVLGEDLPRYRVGYGGLLLTASSQRSWWRLALRVRSAQAETSSVPGQYDIDLT